MFNCPNQSCAIHQKEKEFPALMDCPLCDTPLVTTVSFSENEQAVIDRYPYVIAYPFNRMLEEPNGRNKLELLAYTFLNGLKYLGLIVASEYFHSTLKSQKINEHFRNNLFQPSFGNWNAFLRETTNYLQEQQVALIFPEFVAAYQASETVKNCKKYKTESPYTNDDGQIAWKKSEGTAIGTLINFRNRYLGHGVPLSKEEYQNLYKEIYPVFTDFLSMLSFTQDFPLMKCDRLETWLLMGKEVMKFEGITSSTRNQEGNVQIQNTDGRKLTLLPFYVMPRHFTAGTDEKAQVLVYEQNTGQRVVFYSPESIKAEASGEILERIKLLLELKEQEELYTADNFNRELLQKRFDNHNEKTLTGLKKEKKIIDGIYQPRHEAEAELSGWFAAMSGLFLMAAEAGSGKTNVLAHMLGRYQTIGMDTLLIRANRANDVRLEEELKSILNIEADYDLADFISKEYTVESPLMLLIDGGNEHSNPAEFLASIIQFLEKSSIGCLKIVLSWRVSLLTDLPAIDINNMELVFPAAKNESNNILVQNAYLLKSLNKIELEGAWTFYQNHVSKVYKPSFSFNHLLALDPLLVEELSNPLLLRLFMELYHGKPLPNASKGFVNIWEKWWTEIKKNRLEADYLLALAAYLMEKSTLQVALDELFDKPELSAAVKNIQIDSPHQQLIRKGVLSQYFHEGVLQVSFTMEASFYYVVSRLINEKDIVDLINKNKIWQEPIKYFLWGHAAKKEDNLLFDLIDDNKFPNELSALALSQYLILHGANATLNKLLQNPGEDDWLVLGQALEIVSKNRFNEEEKLATDILNFSKSAINAYNQSFLLDLLDKADKASADSFFKELVPTISIVTSAEFAAIGAYLTKYGQHALAKEYYEKGLTALANGDMLKGALLEKLSSVNKVLQNLKEAWSLLDNAEVFYKENNNYTKSVEARLLNGRGQVKEAWAMYNESMELYQKAYLINKALWGAFHGGTLNSLLYIGDIFNHLGNYNQALEKFTEYLNLVNFSKVNASIEVANAFGRIGRVWEIKGEHDKALNYYDKSLQIRLQYYGESHPNVATSYDRIGDIWYAKGHYDKAIDYYDKALQIKI